jgi:inward rectifier potassium channel
VSDRSTGLLVIAAYFMVNLSFAAAYEACGPQAMEVAGAQRHASYLEAFFFSVQTLATIGYGRIAPVGLAANLLVTVESLVGLLGLAMATGILFARFSRPIADIVFSRTAIVAPYHGIQAFMFRIANRRTNEMLEVQAQVVFSRLEGPDRVRRFHALSLERPKVVFFPLAWTVVHPIDDESPLWGLGAADLAAREAEFLVLVTAIDDALSQTTQTRTSYRGEEVVWGARFGEMFMPSDGGPLRIDAGLLDRVERVPLPAAPARAAG